MQKQTGNKATGVGRDVNNLINGITIKESIMGLETRLGIIKYDEEQACSFGYGGE